MHCSSTLLSEVRAIHPRALLAEREVGIKRKTELPRSDVYGGEKVWRLAANRANAFFCDCYNEVFLTRQLKSSV